jgi:hypothetical protein
MRNRQFGLQGSEGIPCDIRIGAPIDGWQPNPDIVRNRTNAGDPLRGDLGSSCRFRRSPGAAYDKPGQHREDADLEGADRRHCVPEQGRRLRDHVRSIGRSDDDACRQSLSFARVLINS